MLLTGKGTINKYTGINNCFGTGWRARVMAREIDDAEAPGDHIRRRYIIFILNLLKDFFLMRGYEVLCFSDSTTVLFGLSYFLPQD
jgi:hypothetical protein